jgi:hypothetical protein
MVKQSVGYVKLEWTCPSCTTRNPGPQKTCLSCGAPQPKDVKFEQPAQEKLVTDQAEIAQAKKAPDIHCFFCGTRNAADAKTCSQCGGDLADGEARRRDEVLGAHKTGPVKEVPCPACGQPNPVDAPKCAHCGAAVAKPAAPVAEKPKSAPMDPKIAMVIAGVFLVAMVICCVVMTRTKDASGRVESVQWTRSIGVEALGPVTHQDWRDQIPAGAIIGTCTQKVRSTQDQPAPGANEICGTPYTVDKGTGYGEVVQDCRYEIYDESCSFTVDEWRKVDEISLNGDDFYPSWPDTGSLTGNQRPGKREESYEIFFSVDGKDYTYSTTDEDQFMQCRIGSRWTLKINTLGSVTDIEPAQ